MNFENFSAAAALALWAFGETIADAITNYLMGAL